MRRAGLLAVPYLAGIGLLVALPAGIAVWLAFTDFDAVSPPRFVGLDNLARMAADADLRRAAFNSAVFIAVSVPLRLAAATAFALALERKSRAAAAGRTAVFLPSVVPESAYALLWLWLLNPLYGPFAALGAPDLLTSVWGARIALGLVAATQLGEAFVIVLAARRSLGRDLLEAAAIDGASRWYATRRIVLPLIAPVMGVLALRDAVVGLAAGFIPALVITQGGPRQGTTYLSLHLYREAFRYFRLGYASMLAMVLFLLTAAAVYVQYRLARRLRL